MLNLEKIHAENNRNILLCTDVYKMGHMEQYAPKTTCVYSYLTTRSDKKYLDVVNFGLQYYLAEYLSRPITKVHAEEFLDIRKSILGPTPDTVSNKIFALANLGYVPLRVKSVPEGTCLPKYNLITSYVNTLPEFYWVTGFFESLLLKVWNTSTVATNSVDLRKLVTSYGKITCDDLSHVPFAVHDFGYRGVSSEETAALSGAAHLLSFLGTDTVPAVHLLKKYYGAIDPVGLSVPASEHSVMCSFGEDFEYEAFEHMLETYPTGIVSIVSDTYNLWRVLAQYGPRLKTKILARNGKVVFRPDSGDQEKIICGDPGGATPSERAGALNLLADVFGVTPNKKGFRVLNPKVGLIYGDGFYTEKFKKVLERLFLDGWATSNLVVGIGGLLLQQHSRDDLGFSLKATYVENSGEARNIYKDPITDPGKKSHRGLMRLIQRFGGHGTCYETQDQQSWEQEDTGLLRKVFENGKLYNYETLSDIRHRLNDNQ